MSDSKALKILFDKYWSPSKGWCENHVSEEDFEYAKKEGVMFDNISLEHNLTVTRAIEACKTVSKQKVVDAFIYSLSSRRLDLRSALSSYACGHTLFAHDYLQKQNNLFSNSCMTCTELANSESTDLNVLNFERNKFGGVRHLTPSYIWLDLTLFSKEEVPEPSKEDVKILIGIIESLRNLKGGKLSDAEKSFKTSLKSNKNERNRIICAMAYCGILNIPGYQSFHKSYIPRHDRKGSSNAKSDWPFPADLWIPKYGLNQESIDYWFGSRSVSL